MAVNEDQLSDESQQSSVDLDAEAPCRVCHCVGSEKWADSALAHLNITPPGSESKPNQNNSNLNANSAIEFVGPDGKTFVCDSDLESGSFQWKDSLLDLGCSCKSDLSRAHYACALKWFISRGSTVCEICGSTAKNIRPEDLKKITSCLREYELLRERTENGIVDHVQVNEDSGVDPVAVAAVRRQRLSEISGWFNPRSSIGPNSVEIIGPNGQNGQPSESQSSVSKRAMELTGILIATGLLTITLAWLIAPRVGKNTAKNGLHILLGGTCALAVVIFLRLVVLSRIKSGPTRYWAIIFVFWLLIFGIWASRTHSGHTT